MPTSRSLLASALALALACPTLTAGDETVDWGARVRNLFHDADVSSGAVAILRAGVHEQTVVVGSQDHEPDGVPLDAGSVHVAAALSKPVFAHLALQFVHEGLLDLDAPLAELQPNPRVLDAQAAARITPRMLLAQSSGLPNWSGQSLTLLDEPGAAWHDSGEGYLWLQAALERLSGQSLDELARTRVFAPLGMDDSGYVWRASMAGRLVSGRSSFGQTRPVGRIATANAAGTLLTTVDDMARFALATLTGDGLPPALHAESLSPQIHVPELSDAARPVEVSWGLGWGLAEHDGREAFWHWGDAGDFTAWVLVWRDTGDGLVLLCNDAEGLSLAGTLGRWLRDVPQVAPEHLGYEPWDSADRSLRRRLLTSFRRSVAAGERMWRELADDFSPDERLEQLRRAGFTLLFEGRDDEALALLRLAAEAHPDDPDAHDSLAEAASFVGDWALATEAFERALTLEADPVRGRRLGWVRAERDAPASPRPLDPVLAGRLTGRYGQHVIDAHAGGLRWSRDGVEGRALVALGDGVFRVEGLTGLHLRFVLDGPGPATGLRAESGSGRVDLYPRTP